jgi:hypothetical protein
VFGDGNTWSLSGAVGVGSTGFDIATGSTGTLGSGNFWLGHNSDGTVGNPSLTLSVSSSNFYVGNGSVSVSESGPRIPRGPRVRHGGAYRNTIAYVKHNGAWRIAIPYVKHNGAWKVAGS